MSRSSKANELEQNLNRSGPLGKLEVYLRSLGPGLITGAADDELYVCVSLLVVANTINLGAMAAAQLLLGPPLVVWLVFMALITAALEIFVDYKRYARLFTFSLFAYIFVVFVVPQDWGLALRNTVIPTIQLNKDFLLWAG